MVALWEIEEEVALRCGPFFSDVVADAGTTWAQPVSLTSVVLPSLQSSLDLGDEWTGRYLLRRGLLQDSAGAVSLMPTSTPSGNPIGPYFPTGPLASDRIRRVASVDYTSGTVSPDRPWTHYPASNELIELHYLDPDRELRLAVNKGLDRCFVEDRVSLTATAQATERDITALASWITSPSQIKNAQWNYVGSYNTAQDVAWFRAFSLNGHVWLSLSADPYPNLMLLTARRPISSLAYGGSSVVLGASVAASVYPTPTPIPVTSTAHGLATGQQVQILDGPVLTQGIWTITVTNANTFTLDGTVGAGAFAAAIHYTTYVAIQPLDLQDVPVSLAYAAAAGHIEAWRRFPGKLIGGAQVGIFATQAMAATEFSKQTDVAYSPSPTRPEFDQPFPNNVGLQRV